MIKNFEELKKQLKELSEVINSFKSESVQLRIIDLIFDIEEPELEEELEVKDSSNIKKKKRETKKVKSKKAAPEKKDGSKLQSGQGAVAILTTLTKGNFFDKPKTISNIIEHCQTNMAKKIKPNDISGKLARLTRDVVLIRSKNSDNQYEYKKA